MAAFPALITGGLGFLGGLLDTSDEATIQAAQIGARKAYPGQKSIAKALTPYLWENLDVGLTEDEKQFYRGAGRTSILQGIKSSKRDITNIAASQGLRGGTIASILAAEEMKKVPGFVQIESEVAGADIAKKNKNLQNILAFLALQAGEGEEANLADLNLDVVINEEQQKTIEQLVNEGINEEIKKLPTVSEPKSSGPYYKPGLNPNGVFVPGGIGAYFGGGSGTSTGDYSWD